MKLIHSTEDFKIAGRAYIGFPIILYDSMESAVEANEFLRHYLTRGAISSPRSWANTGRALYDYFGFLEANELDWRDVDRGERKALIAAYRDYSLQDVQLARATVRQRLHYICKFYDYALKQRWVERLPFSMEDRFVRRQNRGFLAHVDASGGKRTTPDVIPRKHIVLPKFLTKQQVKQLLEVTINPHHLMMIRMGLQVGLRVDEIATFPLSYVFDPNTLPDRKALVMVTLDPHDGTGIRTKGMKRRDIWVSSRFMAELSRYTVQVRGLLAGLTDVPQRTLFLTQNGLPYASNGKSIEVFVREIGRKAGIKVHPHMLRHTYATHTLFHLQHNRGSIRVEPLVFLQRQLGHASIETTLIYAHLINTIVDDAVLIYDEEINDWMEDR